MILPRRVVKQNQVASKGEYMSCKAKDKQSDCMASDYGSMRLVHRRNNPNKETLIYIPLSHIAEIQACKISAANHIVVITGISGVITGIITGIITGVITGIITGIHNGHDRSLILLLLLLV